MKETSLQGLGIGESLLDLRCRTRKMNIFQIHPFFLGGGLALSSFIKRKTKAARTRPLLVTAQGSPPSHKGLRCTGEEAAGRRLVNAWAEAGFQQASAGRVLQPFAASRGEGEGESVGAG